MFDSIDITFDNHYLLANNNVVPSYLLQCYVNWDDELEVYTKILERYDIKVLYINNNKYLAEFIPIIPRLLDQGFEIIFLNNCNISAMDEINIGMFGPELDIIYQEFGNNAEHTKSAR